VKNALEGGPHVSIEPALTKRSPAADRFREAMSRIAASVHVVTTDGPAGRHGATATSVASLTDDPATLIVCLNLDSRVWRLASANGVLAINTLSARHEKLARGGPPDKRFDQGVWNTLATGAPALADAIATFDGRIVRETTVGTHAALFVEIDAVRYGEPDAIGLAYHRRAYHPFRAED
jgi:flavin reductase (DIM6/NTAB) family NADH-FMN oxidoreductase RutF